MSHVANRGAAHETFGLKGSVPCCGTPPHTSCARFSRKTATGGSMAWTYLPTGSWWPRIIIRLRQQLRLHLVTRDGQAAANIQGPHRWRMGRRVLAGLLEADDGSLGLHREGLGRCDRQVLLDAERSPEQTDGCRVVSRRMPSRHRQLRLDCAHMGGLHRRPPCCTPTRQMNRGWA